MGETTIAELLAEHRRDCPTCGIPMLVRWFRASDLYPKGHYAKCAQCGGVYYRVAGTWEPAARHSGAADQS